MNLVLLLSAIANVMVMTIMGVDDDYYDDDVDVEMTMTIRIEMGYDHYYSPTLERVILGQVISPLGVFISVRFTCTCKIAVRAEPWSNMIDIIISSCLHSEMKTEKMIPLFHFKSSFLF